MNDGGGGGSRVYKKDAVDVYLPTCIPAWLVSCWYLKMCWTIYSTSSSGAVG